MPSSSRHRQQPTAADLAVPRVHGPGQRTLRSARSRRLRSVAGARVGAPLPARRFPGRAGERIRDRPQRRIARRRLITTRRTWWMTRPQSPLLVAGPPKRPATGKSPLGTAKPASWRPPPQRPNVHGERECKGTPEKTAPSKIPSTRCSPRNAPRRSARADVYAATATSPQRTNQCRRWCQPRAAPPDGGSAPLRRTPGRPRPPPKSPAKCTA